MFQRQRRENYFSIALCLIGGAFLAFLGIASFALPISRGYVDPVVVLLFTMLAGVPLLGFGLGALINNSRLGRRMREYRVDEENMRQFEREYLRGPRKRYEKIVLTDHWLYSHSFMATCLLPLKEVVWVYGSYPPGENGRYVGGFVAVAHFSNGAVMRITCSRYTLDRAIGELAERCPQARFEEYSKERKNAWKERAKQWRISQ